MISLFALIVVLGIVVDDAIIAGESIFNEQERKKAKNPTLEGIRKIQAPVTIGVLTTIAAFSPLIFSTGTLGQILKPIPIIVICVLLLSLLEAFFILPAHLSNPNKWSLGLLKRLRRKVSQMLESFVDIILLPLARFFIAARYPFVCIVAFIVFFAFFQVASGNIKFIFFPQIESDEIRVNLEMPIGTDFETTKYYADIITAKFNILSDALTQNQKSDDKDAKIYKNISTTIGLTFGDRGGPRSTSGATIASHVAEITVELQNADKRTLGAREISQKWRASIPEIPQVENLTFESSLVSGGADINIELSHRNSDILEIASEELKQNMRDMQGLTEVVDSLEDGKKEFIYELTDAGLAAGLTPFDMGLQLRDLFEGRLVDRIQRGSNEIEIFVRYPKNLRENLSTLEQIQLRLPTGERAPITALATIEESFSPAVIKRVDGRQVVSNDSISPDEAIAQIKQKHYAPLQEKYPNLSFALAGQNKDQKKDLGTLGKNMLIAMMVILVMLTSQLRSYAKPFIIMLTIPLGIAGAIYGHWLFGFNLSFISMFGIVALTGVVINDSVVLVDYFNTLKIDRPNLTTKHAALLSLKRRFRPILLTTLTTSLGLFPILLETSLQAQFIIPMAVSLACGIIFASAILVFFIPILLIIFDDIAKLTQKIFLK